MQHFKELTGTLSILPGNLLTKIYKFIRDIFSFHVTTGDSVAKSSISTSEELYFLQPPSLGGAATIFPCPLSFHQQSSQGLLASSRSRCCLPECLHLVFPSWQSKGFQPVMSGSPEGGLPRDREKEAACYIKPGHRHEEGITDTMLQWSEQAQSCPNSRKGDITHISLQEVYEGFVAIFIPLWVTSYRALQVMLRLSNKGFHLKNNETPLKT